MDTEELAQDAIKLKSNSAEEGACNEDVSAEEGDISTQSNLEGSTNDCNVSGSPDVVSGTPQKPPSRRQSFITLEKYVEGKTASPVANTKFTGSLSRTPEDQVSNTPLTDTETMQNPTVKETSQMSSGPNDGRPENDQETELAQPVISADEAEQGLEADPVANGSGQDTEDDGVIPNTQVGSAEADIALAESMECTPLEEHPNDALDSSQNTQNTLGSVEIRRSARRRSKPVRPGEGAAEADEKNKLGNAKELLPNRANVQKSPTTQPEILSQGRPSRRSKNAVELLALEDKVSSRTRTEHAKMRQNRQGRPSRKCTVTDGEVLEDKDQTSDRSAAEETKSSKKSGQKAQLQMAEAEVLSQGKVSKVPTPLNKDQDSQNVASADSQNVMLSPPSLVVGSSHGKRTRKLATETDSEGSSAPPYESLNETKVLQMGDKEENSQESSQGSARYRTRRSSQGINVENSESDASETCDNSHTSKRRRRKPHLSSPVLTPSQPKNEAEQPEGVEQVESQLQTKMESSELTQETETKAAISDAVEPAETKEAEENVKLSETVDSDVSVTCHSETNAEVVKSMILVLERTEKGPKYAVQEGSAAPVEGTSKGELVHVCPHPRRGRGRRRCRTCRSKMRGSSSQDIDSCDSQNAALSLRHSVSEDSHADSGSVEFQPTDSPVHVGDSSTDDAVFEPCTLSTPSAASSTIETHSDASVCKGDGQETLGVEDTIAQGTEGLEVNVEECQTDGVCHPEEIVPLRASVGEHSTALGEPQGLNGDESVAPLLEQSNPVLEEAEGKQANNEDVAVAAACAALPDEPSAVTQAPACVDSPPKQKYVDIVSGLVEVGHSPSSGKTRGVWSPSASPSTSILKKGQKRLLEEESPSPLPKVVSVFGYVWSDLYDCSVLSEFTNVDLAI